jgi:DNA-directed RNA polymerase specialized sigma subunit
MDIEMEYQNWLENPEPANLNKVIEAANPVITSEIHRYQGPKALLRGQAKILAANAVRNYDPTKGTNIRTWITSQMKPLTRYSKSLTPVRVSEDVGRKSAAIFTKEQELSHLLGRKPTDVELADEMGINIRRINKIRRQVRPTVHSSTFDTKGDEDTVYEPATDEVNQLDMASEVVYQSLDPRGKMIYDFKTGSHGKPALSNKEIASRLGVTPSLISQMTENISQRILEAGQRGI